MWRIVGSPGVFANGAYQQSLALDPAGNPVLACADPDQDDRVTVKRWNGASWALVGAAGFSTGEAADISLAIDPNGNPVVAYRDDANNDRITVQRWDGASWHVMGSAGFSGSYVMDVSLVLEASGNPLVAYCEATTGGRATVQRWGGSSWEVVGTSGFSPGSSGGLKLALDGVDRPTVAYRDGVNGSRVTVQLWDGTTWEVLGSAGFSTGAADDLNLAYGVDGMPWLLYWNHSGDLMLQRWNGNSWESMDTDGLRISELKLGFDDLGNPVVAGDGNYGGRTVVKRWNGGSWEVVGDQGFSEWGVLYTSLAMDASGNIMVVYNDRANGDRTTVQRWDDTTWVPVGPVGFSDGYAMCTAIALDSEGYPVVAYGDGGNDYDLTVMRWNGSSWQLVGPAGFADGTISGVSIALDANDNPVVAYLEGHDWENCPVKVRAWNGESWTGLGSGPGGTGYRKIGLGLDQLGHPIVAFNGQFNDGTLYVRRWDGFEWQNMRNGSEYGSQFHSLVMDTMGNPIVAYYYEGDKYVQRWNGIDWENIGSPGTISGDDLCLALHPSGTLVIGSVDFSTHCASVKAWDGLTWQLIGSEEFTRSFSSFSGPIWLNIDGQGRMVVAYASGGMYAKSIHADIAPGFVSIDGVLTLVPNPNSGEELWITLGGLSATIESVQAELHDMSGRLLSTQLLPASLGQVSAELLLPPRLADGVYVASVSADGSRWSTRLIIAKP
ncbi:MAG: T9SS type A sorting domain-containing protein [Flavobacteriales bacterium]|nr:T9SS type A sorting domain-containing protein [Flavobacteriales bacterium]